MLADRLNGIEAALARARLGQADAVQALRGDLLDILTLVPRDPGLDAAADDLHQAALARAEAGRSEAGKITRADRLLGEAWRRFLGRLEAVGFELVPSGSQRAF